MAMVLVEKDLDLFMVAIIRWMVIRKGSLRERSFILRTGKLCDWMRHPTDTVKTWVRSHDLEICSADGYQMYYRETSVGLKQKSPIRMSLCSLTDREEK